HSADLTAAVLAFLVCQALQSRILDRFHEPVSQRAVGNAQGADGLAVGYALLNVSIGRLGVRADGPLVHQGATLDHFRSMIDRDFRSLEMAVGPLVSDAQLGDLAAATGRRVLVTFDTGLTVVERSQAARDGLNSLEVCLIALMRLRIDQTVAG